MLEARRDLAHFAREHMRGGKAVNGGSDVRDDPAGIDREDHVPGVLAERRRRESQQR